MAVHLGATCVLGVRRLTLESLESADFRVAHALANPRWEGLLSTADLMGLNPLLCETFPFSLSRIMIC